MLNKVKLLTLGLIFIALSGFNQPDAKSYYNNGVHSLNNREYIQAIGAFTNAISLNPDYADAYYYRAYAKDLLGKQMGFVSTELCTDLVAALKLGKLEAAEKLEKSCMGECFNIKTAFEAPDMVYCADFSSNELQNIPAESKKLSDLVKLSCANNNLQAVTPQITNLKTILSLDLSGNEIKTIPAAIGNLENLRELHLSKNQISSLPIEFGKLSKLRMLTFRQNRLEEMPKSIARLTDLETLDLAFNQINSLPLEIANLKKLKSLTLVGNDIPIQEQQKIKALLPNTDIYFE